MLKAIFWDWDGVIAATDAFNERVFGEILASLGLPLPDGWYKEYFFGRRLVEATAHYLEAENLPQDLGSRIAATKKGYDGEYGRIIEPYPDAIAAIHAFCATGRFQAIVSGARRAQVEIGIRKFGLTDMFGIVVTSEDYKESKPSPDSYLTALRRANIICGKTLESRECVVIEDTPQGITAAKSAGMFCAAITHTNNRATLELADAVVDDLRALDLSVFTRGEK